MSGEENSNQEQGNTVSNFQMQAIMGEVRWIMAQSLERINDRLDKIEEGGHQRPPPAAPNAQRRQPPRQGVDIEIDDFYGDLMSPRVSSRNEENCSHLLPKT